jgi:hydrogenase maturation factor HypE
MNVEQMGKGSGELQEFMMHSKIGEIRIITEKLSSAKRDDDKIIVEDGKSSNCC